MDKKKLYIELGNWCGLGNQMFQYAFAYTLSKIQNFDLIVKREFNYFLDKFKYIRETQKYICNINCSNIIVENEKNKLYDEKLFNIDNTNDVYVKGYFENINYVNKEEDDIRNIFKFDDIMVLNIRNYLETLKINSKSRLVGVHLRLSNVPNESINTVLYSVPTQEYIDKAMSLFDLENDIFIICSNDIERTKVSYNFKSKNIIWYSEGLFEDMCMLTLCNDYILSPSTYGWWGCFLNVNKDKRIVMMKSWFNRFGPGKQANEIHDLYFKDAIVFDIFE
jgi:hypothetical protein